MRYSIFVIVILFLSGCGKDDHINKCKMTILQTGQKISYMKYDDGYYQKGDSRNYTRDNLKEIVIDNCTKLQWQDNSEVKIIRKSSEEAMEYCENLILGGYDDWRLPNIYELLTIVDYGKNNLAIDKIFKNIVPFNYWSSTYEWSTMTKFDVVSWSVDFKNGNTFPDFDVSEFFVICVRGKQLKKGKFNRDNEKNIVIDSKTKLQWQDNLETTVVKKTWSEAINYCEDLTLGGYNDWRLPNINELYSIVDKEASGYIPISSVFQNTVWHNYWSSTTKISKDSDAWYIDFSIGNSDWNNKNNSYFVRCVRDGK